VNIEERSFGQGDALLDEIRSFADAARGGARPVVSGEDGLRALETATRIVQLVERGGTLGGAHAAATGAAAILDGS
jgi:predicted dehydrogenase